MVHGGHAVVPTIDERGRPEGNVKFMYVCLSFYPGREIGKVGQVATGGVAGYK